MQPRAGRWVFVAFLLAAGAGAAFSTWSFGLRIAELEQQGQDTADRIDRLLTAVAAVTAAHQAYLTPSPDRQTERVPALLEQIRTETTGLRPRVRSLDASRRLQGMAESASALSQIEARAQEHLSVGQDLMAADLVSSEARPAVETLAATLRDLRVAEGAAFARARSADLEYAGTIIGGVAALWALGLIVLARLPTLRAAADSSASFIPATVPVGVGDRELAHPGRPDLSAAADLCTATGRLTTGADLPGLLKRAASLLDASGIVVWMAAGEELFAAAAFGYQPRVISRLGPINRSAINATAAAWRLGTMQVVSGGRGSQGALVAPLLGPDRCIGVLAVEVPHDREEDASTRAVTTMFAAQLAAALAGWPPASAAAPLSAPPLDKAAEA